MENVKYWISHLKLSPHPEGGYFRETYRSTGIIERIPLNAEFPSGRCFSTGIYFLLEGNQTSKFHRIKSDEMWHHYSGGTLLIHAIEQTGIYTVIKLGKNPEKGESQQAVVPSGAWFAAEMEDKNSFALVGCTVSPGFEFGDFEMADEKKLSELFPEHKIIIERLT